ncbi:hypothetical protein N7463_000869 [Penicillium fimorum]|uniref:Uncharacterized protein n=1 Tax=Penicillium fimorum TaxID=1882269 RepID=A0A9W9Y589_9EURO|nr:hypothetical protein N7463_000869 [Penicillium fimorum]
MDVSETKRWASQRRVPRASRACETCRARKTKSTFAAISEGKYTLIIGSVIKLNPALTAHVSALLLEILGQ